MLNLDTVKRLDVWTQHVEASHKAGNLKRLEGTLRKLNEKSKALYNSSTVISMEGEIIIAGRIAVLRKLIKSLKGGK
jgi:hypothetical protein